MLACAGCAVQARQIGPLPLRVWWGGGKGHSSNDSTPSRVAQNLFDPIFGLLLAVPAIVGRETLGKRPRDTDEHR